jgi:hypothetical protein
MEQKIPLRAQPVTADSLDSAFLAIMRNGRPIQRKSVAFELGTHVDKLTVLLHANSLLLLHYRVSRDEWNTVLKSRKSVKPVLELMRENKPVPLRTADFAKMTGDYGTYFFHYMHRFPQEWRLLAQYNRCIIEKRCGRRSMHSDGPLSRLKTMVAGMKLQS